MQTVPAPQKPSAARVRGAPAIQWATIARAERLAHMGAGWSVDHVMRRALALLEQQHLAGETNGGKA